MSRNRTAGSRFLPSVGAARGSVVVVHGLNNEPEVMDDLLTALTAAGYQCERVSLHLPGPVAWLPPAVIARQWTRRVTRAHRDLLARSPDLPVHLLGYSLGALVGLTAAVAEVPARFASLTLWAPPLALTPLARAVRLLAPLHRFGVRLPSAAPRTVRARSSTPLSEYAALLLLHDEVGRVSAQRLPGRTLVVLEPGDELVAAGGVRRWVAQRRLVTWRLADVDRAPGGRTYRHFFLSPAAVGDEQWQRLTSLVRAHLAADGLSARAPTAGRGRTGACPARGTGTRTP